MFHDTGTGMSVHLSGHTVWWVWWAFLLTPTKGSKEGPPCGRRSCSQRVLDWCKFHGMFICLPVCFTVCLLISLDLDGYRACIDPARPRKGLETHIRSHRLDTLDTDRKAHQTKPNQKTGKFNVISFSRDAWLLRLIASHQLTLIFIESTCGIYLRRGW